MPGNDSTKLIYVNTALKNNLRPAGGRPGPTWGYVSHSETCRPLVANVIVRVFCAVHRKGPSPHLFLAVQFWPALVFVLLLVFLGRSGSLSATAPYPLTHSSDLHSLLKTFFSLLPAICLSLTSPSIMAEFVRSQIFGTTFEITSRCAPPEASTWDHVRSDC